MFGPARAEAQWLESNLDLGVVKAQVLEFCLDLGAVVAQWLESGLLNMGAVVAQWLDSYLDLGVVEAQMLESCLDLGAVVARWLESCLSHLGFRFEFSRNVGFNNEMDLTSRLPQSEMDTIKYGN